MRQLARQGRASLRDAARGAHLGAPDAGLVPPAPPASAQIFRYGVNTSQIPKGIETLKDWHSFYFVEKYRRDNVLKGPPALLPAAGPRHRRLRPGLLRPGACPASCGESLGMHARGCMCGCDACVCRWHHSEEQGYYVPNPR